MSEEDREAKIAEWKSAWEQRKEDASPEELEEMLEKEEKLEQWRNMTDEERDAKKE
jgi:hypothetical protein